MSAHPEDYQVAYEAGYAQARSDLVDELSRRGQEALVRLLCDLLQPTAKGDSPAGGAA